MSGSFGSGDLARARDASALIAFGRDWRGALRKFGRTPLPFRIGLTLVAAFLFVALLSLVWTPYDVGFAGIDTEHRLAGPSAAHLFGTDGFGRDVLSQIIAGAWTSLVVGVSATSIAVVIGAAIGLLTASVGRFSQLVLGRFVDIAIALPGILTGLVIGTVLGPGRSTAIIAIVVWMVPISARVTIGPARQILARPFIEASRSYGRGTPYILVRHVIPNILPVLLVLASGLVGAAILVEAGLSFLGVGVQPPTPSWGRLLTEAQPFIQTTPTLSLFPGAAIGLTILGFTLLGDGLRAILDPQRDGRLIR